ncbi:NAD(P)-binding protein [Guyanagaster necrorhizus]|uniref:NAD(P)-binding protein n=1 Tax=Guyanagaster necrorhizus TaxID=856835 RepID=A0A9P7VFH3_9AGAR|nr:NAD(P)-binding protein [Guyanagaster necrorhizus MCA 3950]KAG7439978.1 NAD(P)-binding protein [Guyanagaster necrorhizus MCA 3950]
MPAIQGKSAAKVLVSGANGYIAIWVVRTLLERGYSVRGTVRSAEKGRHLLDIFKGYGDKIEVVVVEDITTEGAFDEAVKGVDAIAHTASPFHLKAVDPQELIGPAVKGTVGMLASALKNGSSVQRIVVTSSCAAILHVSPEPKVFSEVDWNEQSIKEVGEQGKDASGIAKYRASKTLAERAAWDFYKKHKHEIQWDLAVINPPFVFGPFIHDSPSIDSLNESARVWYSTVAKADAGGRSPEFLATQGSCWIDVRDLAEGHTRAMETPAAGDERIIISVGPFVWQDWIDTANALSPSPIPSHTLPKGVPDGGKGAKHAVYYDTAKEKKIFGLKLRTMEETARDTLADFERRGW